MKLQAGSVPGVHIEIHVGHPTEPVPVIPQKPKQTISDAVIKQRLENLRKGREKKRFNSDIYPKKVTHDNTKETAGLAPTPRKGYYH